LEAEPGVQQERHDGDVPALTAAFHGPAQGVLLTPIEPAWPSPFPEDEFRQGGERPRRQEARRRGPGQKAFEGGELAIHAAGLEPPMVHQEALVVPEIGRGDEGRGQLFPRRVPEPAGEGRQVAALFLIVRGLRSARVRWWAKSSTAVRSTVFLSGGALLYGEFFAGS
jgi:hypothetical protein